MKVSDRLIVVFESCLRENFKPLSLTRPTFDFLLGAKTLFERIEQSIGETITAAIVPKYLEEITKENHPGLRVNEDISERSLLVNSLLSCSFNLKSALEKSESSETFSTFESGTNVPVFALLDEFRTSDLAWLSPPESQTRKSESRLDQRFKNLRKHIVSKALIKSLWQLNHENSTAIGLDYDALQKDSRRVINSANHDIKGTRLTVLQETEIDKYVSFDTRSGPIIVDEGAQIENFSHLRGPCYIGRKTLVKSARVGEGTSIGQVCKISGEIEESIMFDYSNKNHAGYIGHSILGSWLNLGAMTTNSDLKNTYGLISVKTGGEKMATGLNKLGVFVGDMSKTAIGVLMYSGKHIGTSSHLFGRVKDDVPSFTLYSGETANVEQKEIYLESAIETQKRMMQRRKLELTKAHLDLIKSVFQITEKDRIANGVKKGRFHP